MLYLYKKNFGKNKNIRKEGNPMLYQKEIDDSVLIQFIILFTLDNVDRPVAYNDLLNLVLDNCNINYNDFQIALDNLTSTDHVQTFLEGSHNQIYAITQKGSNAEDFFKSHIPIYIREPIEKSIKELFRNERIKNAIRGGISPVRKNEYSAECALYDDDNTQLMSLSLYIGDRELAEKAVEYFKSHSEIVYQKILEAITETEQSSK